MKITLTYNSKDDTLLNKRWTLEQYQDWGKSCGAIVILLKQERKTAVYSSPEKFREYILGFVDKLLPSASACDKKDYIETVVSSAFKQKPNQPVEIPFDQISLILMKPPNK